MQIVIDIDDNLYTRLFDNGGEYVADRRMACVAIRKGVPLPKGHGRLIDADELYKQDKEEWLCPNNAPFISTDYAHVFAEIDHAPTIIEADKAGEEE